MDANLPPEGDNSPLESNANERRVLAFDEFRVPLREEIPHGILCGRIIGVFYDVYNELGYGFRESVYADAMEIALVEAGMRVNRERELRVTFRRRIIRRQRADFIADESVLVENMTGRFIDSEHELRTISYLKTTSLEVALIFNFGPRPTFKRFIYSNERKRARNQCPPSDTFHR